MDQSDPGSSPDGAHPAVGGTPIEGLTVVAQQDGPVSPFADGEVDGSSGTRHSGMRAGLLPLPTMRSTRCLRSNAMSSIFAPQASLTRRPFNPSNTASAAWAWSNRSDVKKKRPSSSRSSSRRSLG